MKCNIFKISLFILIPLIVLISVSGCTFFSPLVGKWVDTKSTTSYEFSRSGNVIIESNGYYYTGKYTLLDNSTVQFNMEGLLGELINLSSATTWRYTISNDTLTLQGGGTIITLTRTNSSPP